MLVTLSIILGVALAIHLYRQYWFHRQLPQLHCMKFDGEFYQAGETSLAIKRPESGATRTLICFPGFLEDMRYFLSLYERRGYELILINNANYHSPFDMKDSRELPWEPNPHQPGSIEYDAFHLARAVKQFATTDRIVIHGHSRGGAVVLDAGRQFPEIMKDETKRISVLLEAPVLPQGTVAGGKPGPVLGALTLYLAPIFLGLARNISEARLLKLPMMKPTTELKTGLLRTLFCNAKSHATCVENLRNIAEWQEKHRYDLYENYHEITVLIGERDDVLSTKAMTASAREGARRNPRVRVVETTETNHFISLETPDAIYEALGESVVS